MNSVNPSRTPWGFSDQQYNIAQAESALDSILRHFLMNRLQLLIAVTTGPKYFRNACRQMFRGYRYIDDGVIDGLWRACLHMVTGSTLPQEMTLTLAKAELDAYQPKTREKVSEDIDPRLYQS